MIRKFVPYRQIGSVYELDLEQLKQEGVAGIITDLDNTLVGAKVALATPELAAWLRAAADSGLRVIIVSNNAEPRVARFAEPLALPFIYRARKPLNGAFHRALKQLGLPAEQVVVIGDQLLTDVWGGNRLGMRTILVDPIELTQESFGTRINRRIEKWIWRSLGGRKKESRGETPKGRTAQGELFKGDKS